MNPERGFSLVEVLVALMVVGMALPALLGQMQSQTSSQALLRDKTLALYVAQNKIAEYRLLKMQTTVQGGAKIASSESGEAEMAGVRWFWRTTTTNFSDIKAQQVEVAVGLSQDDTLASVTAVFNE